jgi:hypothetical protein
MINLYVTTCPALDVFKRDEKRNIVKDEKGNDQIAVWGSVKRAFNRAATEFEKKDGNFIPLFEKDGKTPLYEKDKDGNLIKVRAKKEKS